MKKIIIFVLITFLFNQVTLDSVNSVPKLDFSKGFNIPGIVPEKMEIIQPTALLPYQIEEIKLRAKNFISSPVTKNDIVTLETNRGFIKIKLFPDVAPEHCNNLKKLANSGYYDGTTFHRIIPGFMIQGGDINSRDNDPYNDGHGGPGWTIDAEFNSIEHKRGILSMARSKDVNSAGSQFFICVADAPHLNGKYTAFGEVIENLYVIDRIVESMTESSQVRKMSRESIPNGEDPNNWIRLQDLKTGKLLYSKIPKNVKKVDHEYEMRKKIRSDKPVLPIKIVKMRVESK